MSNQHNIGSFTEKQKQEEDKCGLYGSSRTDSGFLSGEIHSEEFTDSGILEEKKKVSSVRSTVTDSGVLDEDSEYQTQDDLKKSTPMLLDSGVCLSENFAKISINQGLNDLDAPKKAQPVDSAVSLSDKFKSQQPTKEAEDIPWKAYYEQDEDGDTHLHLSVVSGYVELALALIRSAPHPYLLDVCNIEAYTPLHLAVLTGQSQVARWLIVAGANPSPRGPNGDTPLHIAAKANDYKCVKAIADPVKQEERDKLALKCQGQVYRQCEFDQWNYVGQTCVHIAALYGNIEVLRHLVWYGANVNAKEGCGGYTALHIAVERADEPLVQFLSQCDKIDLEALNYRGRNALEVTRIIPTQMMQLLRTRGVPSPYVSDSEEDSDSSDDEIMFDNAHLFSARMVNASA